MTLRFALAVLLVYAVPGLIAVVGLLVAVNGGTRDAAFFGGLLVGAPAAWLLMALIGSAVGAQR